jgi:hypothetical protein
LDEGFYYYCCNGSIPAVSPGSGSIPQVRDVVINLYF